MKGVMKKKVTFAYCDLPDVNACDDRDDIAGTGAGGRVRVYHGSG